ncbi:hydrophobic compound transporter HcuB [Sphingomonas rosea]|uniref:Hydrophobic compound transporter HcuB n=1 Tax=Sphingomonas rosea TaxID=335605 RepID=A0ABP7U7W3_9SPHN
MRRTASQALFAFGLVLSSCGSPAVSQAERPAAAGAKPFVVTPLGTFDSPWAMTFLPGGSALVTEKGGQVKWWQPDGKVTAVAGAPKVQAGGQGGLLDIVAAPDVATSKLVYLTYSEPSATGGSGLALARARIVTDGGAPRLEGLSVIWRDPAGGRGGQYGARIAFAPDGQSLFLSSGERQRFTPAQDPGQPLGKILHLTLDGKPAAGNPFAGKTGPSTVTVFDPPEDSVAAAKAQGRSVAWPGANLTPAETWSSGHRNPYGLAFGPDGRLWETEMGPQGGDEVNLILPGKNYGWPRASNGSNYNDVDIPDHKPGDGFEAPKVSWNPSISPAGLIVYTGDKFPQWRGDLLLGALSGQALIRVNVTGDKAQKADQWDMGARVREVEQGPDGNVYLLEDGEGGRLLRLSPA